MSTQTLIVAPILSSWSGNLSDPEKAHEMPSVTAFTDIHDCLSVRNDMISPAAAESITVTPYAGTVANEKIFMFFKVIGEVKIVTTGVNYVPGAITGTTVCYGTALLPGFAMISTYNVSAVAVVGVAASSTVRYLSTVITYPTDTRIEA